MNGKERCLALKRIRREIAEANGIPLVIPECTYEGDCEGTCPRCEEEMRILREGLEAIRDSGRTVVVPKVELPRQSDRTPGFEWGDPRNNGPRAFASDLTGQMAPPQPPLQGQIRPPLRPAGMSIPPDREPKKKKKIWKWGKSDEGEE